MRNLPISEERSWLDRKKPPMRGSECSAKKLKNTSIKRSSKITISF